MPDIVVRQHRAALTSSGATFDVTTSKLGSKTPKAMIAVGGAGSSVGDAGQIRLSIGFSDGVTELGYGIGVRDGGTSENSQNAKGQSVIIQSNTTSNGINYEATFNAWLNNGVRLNRVSGTATRLVNYTFFAGVDVQAKVVEAALDSIAQDGTLDVTTIGFEPDLVFFLVPYQDFPTISASSNQGRIGFGACANVVGAPQFAHVIYARDNRNPTEERVIVANNRCAGMLTTSSTPDFMIECGSFDADGFTLTVRDSAAPATARIACLALKFTGANVDISEVNAPTSAVSDWDITAPGFKPQWAMLAASMFESADLNSILQSGEKATMGGLGWFDGTDDYATSWGAEDGVSPSNTNTSTSSKLMRMLDHAATVEFDMDEPTFETSGIKVTATNIANANAIQRKWHLVTIEEAIAAGASLAPAHIAGL